MRSPGGLVRLQLFPSSSGVPAGQRTDNGPVFPACGLPGTAGAERGILAVLAARAAVALEQRRLAEATARATPIAEAAEPRAPAPCPPLFSPDARPLL
jgi:hypothetical protein